MLLLTSYRGTSVCCSDAELCDIYHFNVTTYDKKIPLTSPHPLSYARTSECINFLNITPLVCSRPQHCYGNHRIRVLQATNLIEVEGKTTKLR